MSTKTAKFLKDLEGFTGSAALFKLSKPVTYGYEDEAGKTSYVVVSSTFVPFTGPETYIFPADKDGEVLSWGELDGSFRGISDRDDHEEALNNAGYDVIYEH